MSVNKHSWQFVLDNSQSSRRPARAQRRATSVDFGDLCVKLKAIIPEARTGIATCKNVSKFVSIFALTIVI